MPSDDARRDALRRNEPLGPIESETLLNRSPESFEALYDRFNGIHLSNEIEQPTYIVGRKGAGKTAFLAGASVVTTKKVVMVASEDIYTQIGALQRNLSIRGAIFNDALAYIWKSLMDHAALLGYARADPPFVTSNTQGRVKNYLSEFGNPEEVRTDALMARVASALSAQLRLAPPGFTTREVCENFETRLGNATALLKDIDSEQSGSRDSLPPVLVVVDNLEELGTRIQDLGPTLASMFRAVRMVTNPNPGQVSPYRVRFAFPAELYNRIRDLSDNPQKDFDRNHLTIRWTAAELIRLCGNRLRIYLDLYYPQASRMLRLPSEHDPANSRAAEDTLRVLLRAELGTGARMRTGLGVDEDPVAYILRHTQLIPRQLIQILNSIFAVALQRGGSAPPVASHDDIRRGVRRAEHSIVEGIP